MGRGLGFTQEKQMDSSEKKDASEQNQTERVKSHLHDVLAVMSKQQPARE
jgi:hypothetical protein